MILRPLQAQWFELLTPRQDLAEVMQILAKTDAVELEASGEPAQALLAPGLGEKLDNVREIIQHYTSHLPKPDFRHERGLDNPLTACEGAIKRLHEWQTLAEPIILQLEANKEEQRDLDLLFDAFSQPNIDFPDLHQLAIGGPTIEVAMYYAKDDLTMKTFPAGLLHKTFKSPKGIYLFFLGRPLDLKKMTDQLRSKGARLLPLPLWLPSLPGEAVKEIQVRRELLVVEAEKHRDDIQTLNRQLKSAKALGTVRLVEWLGQHVGELRGTDVLAWVTGWTSDPGARDIKNKLDRAGVKYLLNLTEPPIGIEAPMVLSNPVWGSRFEVFTKLLGMPAINSVDPSAVVALIAPLLFGYMFGDVGQGAVIMLIGLIFGRRITALKFLIPSGAMAIVFGFLFGSIFSREDIIPALWFHPMGEPIKTLWFGILFGIAILIAGLLLNGIQAHWREKAIDWWLCDVGMLVTYTGLLLVYFDRTALIPVAIGVIWFIFGGLIRTRYRDDESPTSVITNFIETLFQLLVNTVSFARVGAFALAHTGLSAAITGVADAAGTGGYWIVLIFGNALVIALEGLVVSIQVTRLMLFEFFTRFFQSGGRQFRALPPADHNHPNHADTKFESVKS